MQNQGFRWVDKLDARHPSGLVADAAGGDVAPAIEADPQCDALAGAVFIVAFEHQSGHTNVSYDDRMAQVTLEADYRTVLVYVDSRDFPTIDRNARVIAKNNLRYNQGATAAVA